MKQTLLLTTVALVLGGLFTPANAVEKKKSEKQMAQKTAAVAPATTASPEKATEPVKSTEKKAAAPRTLPYQGKVAALDPAAKTFVVKNREGKEHIFFVTEKTVITKDEAPATFEEIKLDEFVRGTRLKIADGKWDAVKVMIGPKEGATKTAQTATKPAAIAEKTGN